MPQEVLAHVTSTVQDLLVGSERLNILGYISARLQGSVNAILLPHGRNCGKEFGRDEVKTLIQPSMDNIHLTSF